MLSFISTASTCRRIKTMTVPFSFNRTEGNAESIVLLDPAHGVRMIADSHVRYAEIKGMLIAGTDDAEAVYAHADAATAVADTLTRLSERVTLKGDTILFDGDPVESRLTRHIVEMIKGLDENYGGYVAFLEKLQANPSRKSRKGLFRFLARHDLIITPDGDFIAYKGVMQDGRSSTAGAEDVTVT